MKVKCAGKYCGSAPVHKEFGKGSFKGYVLYLCSHCGNVLKMVRPKKVKGV